MSTDERMEKMEGQLARVRWFNRCLIACIVLSLGAWFISKTFGPETTWAQSGVKEIRANRFVLENENGNISGVLDASTGAPTLRLNDEEGNPRCVLTAEREGGILWLADGWNRVRVTLSVTKDKGADLELSDENSQTRLQMQVASGTPKVILRDENGKGRASLLMSENGSALLLTDGNGKGGAMLAEVDEQGKLSLRDKNGKVIGSVP